MRYGEAGLIDVWPVGELAIFDTNEWRRPANELAVVEKASKREIASSGRTLLAMTEIASRKERSSQRAKTNEVDSEEGEKAETALETAEEAEKSAAVLEPEAVLANDDKLNLERVDDPTEEDMDATEIKTLTDGVVSAIGPMMDEKLDARLKTEKGGLATGLERVTKPRKTSPGRSPAISLRLSRWPRCTQEPRTRACEARRRPG